MRCHGAREYICMYGRRDNLHRACVRSQGCRATATLSSSPRRVQSEISVAVAVAVDTVATVDTVAAIAAKVAIAAAPSPPSPRRRHRRRAVATAAVATGRPTDRPTDRPADQRLAAVATAVPPPVSYASISLIHLALRARSACGASDYGASAYGATGPRRKRLRRQRLRRRAGDACGADGAYGACVAPAAPHRRQRAARAASRYSPQRPMALLRSSRGLERRVVRYLNLPFPFLSLSRPLASACGAESFSFPSNHCKKIAFFRIGIRNMILTTPDVGG